MALNLRSCKDIKGITVKLDEKNHSIKISQLADDTTLFYNKGNERNTNIRLIFRFIVK